ncbi:unnamed protein product [Victoria cruziana]
MKEENGQCMKILEEVLCFLPSSMHPWLRLGSVENLVPRRDLSGEPTPFVEEALCTRLGSAENFIPRRDLSGEPTPFVEEALCTRCIEDWR